MIDVILKFTKSVKNALDNYIANFHQAGLFIIAGDNFNNIKLTFKAVCTHLEDLKNSPREELNNIITDILK